MFLDSEIGTYNIDVDLATVSFYPAHDLTMGSEPSWFGFPLGVRETAPFSREALVQHLEAQRIGTRLLFGGNLARQPAHQDVEYRSVGELPNADFVLYRVFWLAVYSGLDDTAVDTPKAIEAT